MFIFVYYEKTQKKQQQEQKIFIYNCSIKMITMGIQFEYFDQLLNDFGVWCIEFENEISTKQ